MEFQERVGSQMGIWEPEGTGKIVAGRAPTHAGTA